MKKVAVSVHDVTPRFEKELEIIFSELDKSGVPIRSELVVPDYQRQFNLGSHPEFCAMLKEHRKGGCDVSLHGIYHDYAEFYRFDYNTARDALNRGLDIFESAFDFSPPGFVAPQWLQSRGSLRAVREHDFAYTSTLTGVHFKDGSIAKAFPLNYDWGLNSVDHIISCCNSLACRLRRGGLIRFSMHPLDIPDRMFDAEMKQLHMLLDHGWEPVSYEQLSKEVI
jgi:peptidoglycan/xylan/chitin deacetylase (PgdA/CDA1 family)